MRYAVSFSHKRYQEIQERLLSDEPGYEIPLGVYRQLVVVVEASSAEEAIGKAGASLGWPDEERDLHPMGVASQEEIRVSLLAQAETLPKPLAERERPRA